MVIVTSGLDKDGQPCSFYLDGNLYKSLKEVKKRVTTSDFDCCMIVAGPPGYGKSTFIRGPAKYLDPNFNEKNIAFSADQFIELTNTLPKHSSIVLDESFESLNARATSSKDFQMILNHLQIIRQRNLFIFLCLPDFFGLSKNVAIFRASYLFVTYLDEEGKRGRFLAFSRDGKRLLYIKGGRYLNYSAHKANFRGIFRKYSNIIDVEAYEKRKFEHLMSQGERIKERDSHKSEYKTIISKVIIGGHMSVEDMSLIAEKSVRTIQRYVQEYRKMPNIFVKTPNKQLFNTSNSQDIVVDGPQLAENKKDPREKPPLSMKIK